MSSFIVLLKKFFALILSLFAVVTVDAPAVDVNTVYVSSSQGSDASSGEYGSPVKTIGRAIELMNGEKNRIYIYSGEYHETVTVNMSGITLEGGYNTVITGANEIEGEWEKYSGHIYRIPLEERPESVFADGEQMLIARWPNTSYNSLCSMKRASSDEGTGMYTLVDSVMPSVDFTGGKLTIWNGSGWLTCFREISSCEKGKSISWEEPIKSYTDDYLEGFDCYAPQKNNYYYISDLLLLLDYPGEWYYDEEDKMLYFYAPDGRNPSKSDVRIKRRDFGIVTEGENITFKNISLFGCGVSCKGNNCTFDGVNVRCADFFINSNMFDSNLHQKNYISGNGNIWKNSEISDTWGDGIGISGNSNIVENCHIHHVDYAGAYYGCVNVTGSDNTVKNCTLHDTGRYNVMHSGAKRLKILGCDMYNSALLSYDCGSVYSWGTDAQGTEIAFNRVHDNREVGIYIDNNCSGYSVHDNLVTGNGIGISMNSHFTDCVVENNIFLKNDRLSSTYYYEVDGPSMAGSVIKNNTYMGEWNVVEGDNAPGMSGNRQVKSSVGVKLPDREYGCDLVK